MLTIREAKKIPFSELDDETKEYMYDIFKRYVVRKRIADTNKTLSTLFSVKMRTTNPRDYASAFNEFNSYFVGATLIRELDYDEIHTHFLRDMTEERFNVYLSRNANTFNRKVALMCFSMRPSERIPNRVEFPVMVAYANMQALVLKMAEVYPKMSLTRIFEEASKTVRSDFYRRNGYRINDSKILPERVDYISLGKRAAPIWKQMLDFYWKGLESIEPYHAARFVRDNFVFLESDLAEYDLSIVRAQDKAEGQLAADKVEAETRMEENPDTYIPADYDEVFTARYSDDVLFRELSVPMRDVFLRYLDNPIFEEKETKKKGE